MCLLLCVCAVACVCACVCAALSKLVTELQHQLATTHDKFSDQLTQNMALTNRVRELTDSIAQLRAVAARGDDAARHLETAEHSLNATREEVGVRERYTHRAVFTRHHHSPYTMF